jgi:hypothetical protein
MIVTEKPLQGVISLVAPDGSVAANRLTGTVVRRTPGLLRSLSRPPARGTPP